MKLVGFVGSDFNVDQLTVLGANVQHRGSFVANLVVRPYNAHIQFDSYDENRYRPYLQLDAELIGGRGSFGNDVTEFGYRENDYLNRSIRYDFTDHELALLVEKGLYQPDFEVPEIFTDTDFEIPIEMDITEVELNGNRLIYASYDMISDLQTDSEKSGYNLVEYFDEQHYENEKSNDFEDHYVDENEFVAEIAEREVEDEVTEPVVEEKPVVEPMVVYENEIDVIASLGIDDVFTDDKLEIEDIIQEEKAPSEPVITNNNIRKQDVVSATDEFDAAKANTARIAREVLEEYHEREESQGLSPDVDAPEW